MKRGEKQYMLKVSIKGILKKDSKYLLRINERDEYELLGGKLEQCDLGIESRVIQEFLEESGIEISVHGQKEPWLYCIGNEINIIVPIICKGEKYPKILYDEDGGKLEWVKEDKLNTIRIPEGYLQSILGLLPKTSYSNLKLKNNMTNEYEDSIFSIIIDIYSYKDILLESNFLPENCKSIRDYLSEKGYSNIIFSTTYKVNNEVHIAYKMED